MSTYDRASEIKAFDETKAGVKGLVDAGVTKIPQFFIHPANDADTTHHEPGTAPFELPVIDLRGVDAGGDERKKAVEKVKQASETFGFFQVQNHGIPRKVMDEMIQGVKEFHEQDVEVKKQYYTRDPGKLVLFNSNFDLYKAPAANWRDTFFCFMAPAPPAYEDLPVACRDIIIEYSAHIRKLGQLLFELLSEALGLKPDHLNEIECSQRISLSCHYYPACPEPDLTLGATKHSDPSFLTILLQDDHGGLQVLHQHHWIDVRPLPGCFVVNIGDLLQMISNDRLKSNWHRVLACKDGPRISVASFFSSHSLPSSRLYGPMKELLIDGEQPRYREVLAHDFVMYYNSKGLDGRSALDNFKLPSS